MKRVSDIWVPIAVGGWAFAAIMAIVAFGHAEECRAPSVARAYIRAGKPFTSDLRCPDRGLCWIETAGGSATLAGVGVVYLTPAEEFAAMAAAAR